MSSDRKLNVLNFKGTFEAEKRDETLAYGLVHPIQSYDPTYVQVTFN